LLNIAIIDDNQLELDLLSHQLSFLDATIYKYNSAELAIEELSRISFSIVICDLQMPKTDGIEVIRHLAEFDFGGGLIILSGEDTSIIRAAKQLALSRGLNLLGALQKPVTLAQLKEVFYHGKLHEAKSAAPVSIVGYDALLQAIELDQFENYYQPKVSASTGECLSVETLIRWNHPELGVLGPDSFIQTAENYKILSSITNGLISRGLEQATAWSNGGLDVDISVNVSMLDLERIEFSDEIKAIADETGFDLNRLTVEITESRLLKNIDVVLDILTRLRLKHVRLSIDDFGTGHSSLRQLLNLPFNEMKIDKSFINGLEDNEIKKAIVSASLEIAKKLQLVSVAEGIESISEWAIVKDLGCDQVQGFLVAEPMKGEEIPDWIARWNGSRRAKIIADVLSKTYL